MINRFLNTYTLLTYEQQQFITKILQYLPHPKVDIVKIEKHFDISTKMEILRKEKRLTQGQLCNKASELRNVTGDILTIDGYKSLLKRNTQDSLWYPYIAKALGVTLTELKNRTEESIFSLIFHNEDLTNTSTLFNTLCDKDKDLIMFIMRELMLIGLEIDNKK